MTDEIAHWLGEAPELHSVIPVIQEVRGKDGRRTVVSSVEIWNTMLMVRCTTIAPDRTWGREHGLKRRVWHCQDDVDTPYRPTSGGGAGGERYWAEWAEFQPAPPAHARRLFLEPPDMASGTIIEVAL